MRDERLAALRDEQMLRECGLDVPQRVAATSPAPRAADPWPARCRVDWVRAVAWGAVAGVTLVWAALLVQGVAWALDVLT